MTSRSLRFNHITMTLPSAAPWAESSTSSLNQEPSNITARPGNSTEGPAQTPCQHFTSPELLINLPKTSLAVQGVGRLAFTGTAQPSPRLFSTPPTRDTAIHNRRALSPPLPT